MFNGPFSNGRNQITNAVGGTVASEITGTARVNTLGEVTTSCLQDENNTKRTKGRWDFECFIIPSVPFAERWIMNTIAYYYILGFLLLAVIIRTIIRLLKYFLKK